MNSGYYYVMENEFPFFFLVFQKERRRWRKEKIKDTPCRTDPLAYHSSLTRLAHIFTICFVCLESSLFTHCATRMHCQNYIPLTFHEIDTTNQSTSAHNVKKGETVSSSFLVRRKRGIIISIHILFDFFFFFNVGWTFSLSPFKHDPSGQGLSVVFFLFYFIFFLSIFYGL